MRAPSCRFALFVSAVFPTGLTLPLDDGFAMSSLALTALMLAGSVGEMVFPAMIGHYFDHQLCVRAHRARSLALSDWARARQRTRNNTSSYMSMSYMYYIMYYVCTRVVQCCCVRTNAGTISCRR